jgi:hypothetical protein
MLLDEREHLAGIERFESRPAEILAEPRLLILPFREHALLCSDFWRCGFAFFDGVHPSRR